MRVLIVSQGCWRDDSNGGNVLSNLFSGMKDTEFAQVYCKGGLPQNNICKRYYRMNDGSACKSIFTRSCKIGKEMKYDKYPNNDSESKSSPNERFYDFFRAHDLPLFFLMREFLWAVAPWKNQEFKNFLLDFNPDLIFAPCYGAVYMLKMDRWIKKITNAPMVSYISDDNYSLKQVRFDPLFWVYRLWIRKNIRKTARTAYEWMYTMTEKQAEELSSKLNIRMPILRKGSRIEKNITSLEAPKETDEVRIIYAGGTYLGRDRILYDISIVLKQLNTDGFKCRMDIYTNSKIGNKYEKGLNSEYCSVHKAIPKELLESKYNESDIALHVESFSRKYAYQTRLSFSTKIVDCLSSGCAVLAICPPINAGWQYLKEENAALCIGSKHDIGEAIKELVSNKKLRNEKREDAHRCLEKNHDIDQIQYTLYQELKTLVHGQ